jgi:DNA recombination-dependent growth factor C
MEDELDFLGEMAAANSRGETVHSLLRKILEKLTVSLHHSKLSMVYIYMYIIFCLLDYQ